MDRSYLFQCLMLEVFWVSLKNIFISREEGSGRERLEVWWCVCVQKYAEGASLWFIPLA